MKKLFWDDYLELPSMFGIGTMMILFTIIIAVLSIWFNEVSCYRSFEQYNPDWSFISGCRIEFQGKLTPVDMIKNINL